jgi:hypothetical protein
MTFQPLISRKLDVGESAGLLAADPAVGERDSGVNVKAFRREGELDSGLNVNSDSDGESNGFSQQPGMVFTMSLE